LNDVVKMCADVGQTVDAFGAALYPAQDFETILDFCKQLLVIGKQLAEKSREIADMNTKANNIAAPAVSSSSSSSSASKNNASRDALLSLGLTKLNDAYEEIQQATSA